MKGEKKPPKFLGPLRAPSKEFSHPYESESSLIPLRGAGRFERRRSAACGRKRELFPKLRLRKRVKRSLLRKGKLFCTFNIGEHMDRSTNLARESNKSRVKDRRLFRRRNGSFASSRPRGTCPR